MSFFDENNPFIGMFDQLSEEDKELYRKSGEYMYNLVDFETSEVIKKDEQVPDTDFKSILDALRSGLSIDDLTDKERETIALYCGSVESILAGSNRFS